MTYKNKRRNQENDNLLETSQKYRLLTLTPLEDHILKGSSSIKLLWVYVPLLNPNLCPKPSREYIFFHIFLGLPTFLLVIFSPAICTNSSWLSFCSPKIFLNSSTVISIFMYSSPCRQPNTSEEVSLGIYEFYQIGF